MNAPDLPPIPIPRGQRWRDFRVRLLPLLAFCLAAVAIAKLWRDAVSPATLAGQVEPVVLRITSPLRGTMVSLAVDRFAEVRAGAPIAALRGLDAREELDVMRGQLDLASAGADAETAARRDAIDFQKLRLSWLEQKVEVAATEIKLQFAAAELDRAAKLFADKAITEKAYKLNRRQKEAIEVEVTERARLIADLGRELELIGTPTPSGSVEAADDSFRHLLRTQFEKMRAIELTLGALTLTAPMDGTITAILLRPGENVEPGDVVALMTGARSERIVGYVRQPLALEPQVGMPVEIQTRSPRRERARGRIVRLGPGFEPIANPDLHPSSQPESGLPIEVSLPPDLKLRPGEVVSLTLGSRP